MGQLVGILGLQGDFALHQECLKRVGVESKIIRRPEELKPCNGLILPGGESSTFIKLLKETGLVEGIKKFAMENKQKLLRGVQGGGFLEKNSPGRRRQKGIFMIGETCTNTWRFAKYLPLTNGYFLRQ